MCPREAIARPGTMSRETFQKVLERMSPQDVFRAVIAGYGEPTTHPKFEEFIHMIKSARVPVDMVSNGEQLNRGRLKLMDGILNMLIISFSSVEPQVYNHVHVNLKHHRVMENIVLAGKILKKTKLAISLTPMAECIETLPQTIGWLRSNGINHLTMSPSLYDRAGSLHLTDPASRNLRQVIRSFGLHSQEFDFIPGISDIFGQWLANRFKCIPRNTDLLVSAEGMYLYCFNDIRRCHPLASVHEKSVRGAIHLREALPADSDMCSGCNIRERYGPGEIMGIAWNYARSRLVN
jgi:MoaA/NifB/PqqE/SkfB family radical SAM enzyme